MEVFNLKSLYLEDTVVRGSRVNIKNSPNTKTLLVNPDNPEIVKTGETGIEKEYLLQASLIGNDLRGYGTISNYSEIITNYTGSVDLVNSDSLRIEGEQKYYTITGINIDEHKIYLSEKYIKENSADPDVRNSFCYIRKTKLGSVKYEKTDNNIYYADDKGYWGVTGAEFSEPIVAFKGPFELDTNIDVQFQEGVSKKESDLSTISSIRKTLVFNNTSNVYDVAIDPIPYPHESLQVYISKNGSDLVKAKDLEDYIVNYDNGGDIKYPYPPYEDRKVAYLKFLDSIEEERQKDIDSSFNGNIEIVQEKDINGDIIREPIREILPDDSFSIKVDNEIKRNNFDYLLNHKAGTLSFVDHINRESLVSNILYSKKLCWDGFNVIRGVKEEDVKNVDDLIIKDLRIIPGIDYPLYFEDNEDNNLIRDRDFILDIESGIFKLNFTPRKDEAFLVSYYVEGEDVKEEKVDLTTLRLMKYPLISGSLVLTLKYGYITEEGAKEYKTKVLVEGIDYRVSYITGYIELYNIEEIKELGASYTPLAQINCVLKGTDQEGIYQITIIEDVLTYTGNNENQLSFKINNPVVSIPQKNNEIVKDKNYSFINTLDANSISYVKVKDSDIYFDLTNIKYSNLTKEIVLDSVINNSKIIGSEVVVSTYTFRGDTIPYAPILLINNVLNKGDNFFVIDGYNRTSLLRSGGIIRIDNKDPIASYYFLIKECFYEKSSTYVVFYDTIPQTIIDPIFYVLDEPVSWKDFPSDIVIDKDVSIGSNVIKIKNRSLFIRENVRKGSLLLVNGTTIYETVSVSIQGSDSIIEISTLLSAPIEDIKFSSFSIYTEGEVLLYPTKYIIEGNNQPAFTLYYNPPKGFEGKANIVFSENFLLIEEYLGGIKNPQIYRYDINEYRDIKSFIDAIVSTKSTFPSNVPFLDLTDFYPFTIIQNNLKRYYLGEGFWRIDSLFIERDQIFTLPYTFRIYPSLEKTNLINVEKDSNVVLIKENNIASYFEKDDILLLLSIDNSYCINKLKNAYYNYGDTVLELSFPVEKDLFDISIYKASINWINLNEVPIDINYDLSIISFEGKLRNNIRKNTLILVDNTFVYQVHEVIENDNDYRLLLYPRIDRTIEKLLYKGSIKYSSFPIELENFFEDIPSFYFNYKEPEENIGEAKIKINDDGIAIEEVINNVENKTVLYSYNSYGKLKDLLVSIQETSSIISTYKPYKIIVNPKFEYIIESDIKEYNLLNNNEYDKLPKRIDILFNLFEVDYTPITGYDSYSEVVIDESFFILREKVFIDGQWKVKENLINYREINNINTIVENIIPSIKSVVSDNIYPFSATLRLYNIIPSSGILEGLKIEKVIKDKSDNNKSYFYVRIYKNNFFKVSQVYNKLLLDVDYTVLNGYIELNKPIKSYERYFLTYMGLDPLVEYENKSIYCSCRFISYLPPQSKLTVFYEYLSRDQFYIQKITERKFIEIVVLPQIKELISQKNSPNNFLNINIDTSANYYKGIGDVFYQLRDEYIKKQLFLRIYQWYKQRLRNFGAELQLILGLKFAHSNFVEEVNNYYTIEDYYVELNNDYTLTKLKEIEEASKKYSKFFPIEYNGQAPHYYNRFDKEYLLYNEVFCCNIKYKNDKNQIVTIGIVKSEKPYWREDLDFNIIEDENINKSLIGYYVVDIPEEERVFSANQYSFLKIIEIGDEIKLENYEDYHKISEIKSTQDKSSEYIILDGPFLEKEIRLFDITETSISLEEFITKLPSNSYKIWLRRKNKEEFPLFDDNGSLGASAYGNKIIGHIEGTHRIKKPVWINLLKILFPFFESFDVSKKFKIMVKKDTNKDWESVGVIDLSKLTFKEECNIDDVLDALRYDFTEKYIIPTNPPYTVYDIKENDNKGFHRYFYISFEKIYDPDSSKGYYEGIVFRAKNRKWWFKIENDGDLPVIEDYGFKDSVIYKNFYDPNNLYYNLILEKQAWSTYYLIIRDLYDYNNKMYRAFESNKINVKNSRFQSYLISIAQDIKNVITNYEKILRFLIDDDGPVYRILYPDLIHEEKDASFEINQSFNRAFSALRLYENFYNKTISLYNILIDNISIWTQNYVRWALSVRQGIIPQQLAYQSLKENNGFIDIGTFEIPTLSIEVNKNYEEEEFYISLSSDYWGKYIKIDFKIKVDNKLEESSVIFYLYYKRVINNTSIVFYKTLNDICTEVSSFKYKDISLFKIDNIYPYFENNVVQNMAHISTIKMNKEFVLYSTNVEDHRQYDSRILFLRGNVEDLLYCGVERELPALRINYLGNYYRLKYGKIGITIQSRYSIQDVKCGVFLDEKGEKVLILSYTENKILKNETYLLYNNNKDEIVYKTLLELSEEIKETSIVFNSYVEYQNQDLSCANLFITPEYVDFVSNQVKLYIAVDSSYTKISKSLNNFFYSVYNDPKGKKLLGLSFYDIIVDGRSVYRTKDFSDTFIIELQKEDGSYKTLLEVKTEISNYIYKGEKLFTADVLYSKEPFDKLLTIALVYTNYREANYNWVVELNADESLYAIYGKNAPGRNIDDIKNAVFVFPIYTANGNPSKVSIEGIPVSGKWIKDELKEVMRITCIDGTSWTITFSDYVDKDYKSILTQRDIINIIDTRKVISEEEFEEIRNSIEDKPDEAILKELVLKRLDGKNEICIKYNLRKYDTINKLIEAIENTRVNEKGEVDSNGFRKFFTASIIGSPEVEGLYKSYELKTEFVPIVKSFGVQKKDGTVEYKRDYFIGWKIKETQHNINEEEVLLLVDKEYSHSSRCKFLVDSPETSYLKVLNNYPQGFRRDIRAFNIYSWDTNASYEIRENWIYFKSDHVYYQSEYNTGQPQTSIGYGIPLAGSGKVPKDEKIIDLINRINNDPIVKKYFYADLLFTRNTGGDFEYGYLPNYKNNIPLSKLDSVFLRNSGLLFITHTNYYRITSSSVKIEDNKLSLTTSWNFSYSYEKTFYFNDLSNKQLSGLISNLNSSYAPQITNPIIESIVISGLEDALSKKLVPTFVEKNLTDSYTGINIVIGSTQQVAIQLKLRALSGPNFEIKSAKYFIPVTRDRLIIKCEINYRDTYILSDYDLNNISIDNLSTFINTIRPYVDKEFPELYNSYLLSNVFKNFMANRLIPCNQDIPPIGISLIAKMDDIAAFKVLNISSKGTLVINENKISLTTNKIYEYELNQDGDINNIINAVKGDFNNGFVSCGVVPLNFTSISKGYLNNASYTLSSNEAATVFFGILGDIKFIQISDFNLYNNYNYVKDRLGKPWEGEEDYYTPERYDINNPIALNKNAFINFIKYARYNQIKESIIGENLIFNKYLWIYLKLHKELGCDQKIEILKEKIKKDTQDTDILEKML